MYRPPAFRVDDVALVADLLRRAAFGHLVSTDPEGRLGSSSIPFVVDDQITRVRAHLARANPHWRHLDGADVLLIVPGVDTYISPRWYPSKADDPRVVPTWNYELVHLRGTVRVVDDPAATLEIVRALTDDHEARSTALGERPWAVSDAPDEFVARQLRAIVGIEIAVDEVEATRKLSQNRSDLDRGGVVDALTGGPGGASAERPERATATGRVMADLDDPPGIS